MPSSSVLADLFDAGPFGLSEYFADLPNKSNIIPRLHSGFEYGPAADPYRACGGADDLVLARDGGSGDFPLLVRAAVAGPQVKLRAFGRFPVGIVEAHARG